MYSMFFFFFFKQKTAYEIRPRDWSSDVCSSDLKAAGGEPERFCYEGEYAASDFIAEQDQVREPKAINAKLSGKNYKALKSAENHRELLLQATKAEDNGTDIVALRDNQKYPHFREILKDL